MLLSLNISGDCFPAADEDIGIIIQGDCGNDYIVTWNKTLKLKYWKRFGTLETEGIEHNTILLLLRDLTEENIKRKRGRPKKPEVRSRKEKDMTEYNKFLKKQLPLLKEQYPLLSNTDRMRMASKLWQEKPKN